MNSLKRRTLLIGLMIGIFLVTGSVYAHGPKKVTLSFDPNGKVLKVDVSHSVKNPGKHYIKRIRVYVNDEMVEKKFYDRQKNRSGHSDLFTLKDVKSGDTITVKATCNKFGGKKARIKVR